MKFRRVGDVTEFKLVKTLHIKKPGIEIRTVHGIDDLGRVCVADVSLVELLPQ